MKNIIPWCARPVFLYINHIIFLKPDIFVTFVKYMNSVRILTILFALSLAVLPLHATQSDTADCILLDEMELCVSDSDDMPCASLSGGVRILQSSSTECRNISGKRNKKANTILPHLVINYSVVINKRQLLCIYRE